MAQMLQKVTYFSSHTPELLISKTFRMQTCRLLPPLTKLSDYFCSVFLLPATQLFIVSCDFSLGHNAFLHHFLLVLTYYSNSVWNDFSSKYPKTMRCRISVFWLTEMELFIIRIIRSCWLWHVIIKYLI